MTAFLSRAQTDSSYIAIGAPIDLTEFNESAPTLSMDGNTMVFVSNKNNGYELLISTKNEKGEWLPPQPIKAINNFGNIGNYINTPFLSYDGQKLYFSANFAQGYGGMDIYVSKKSGDNWSEPKNMGQIINSAGDEKSPSLPIDEKVIYFTRKNLSANNKNANCKTIFTSHYEDNKWQIPLALSTTINYDCEETPFISYDNTTLYFSSIRYSDHATYKIYKSKKIVEGVWTECVAVAGSIIQLHSLNPCVVFKDNSLYFTRKTVDKKNKKEGIYHYNLKDNEKPMDIVILKGSVFLNEENNAMPNAQITVRHLITSHKIAETKTNSEGEYKLLLDKGKQYKIDVAADGTTNQILELDTRKGRGNNLVVQNFTIYDKVRIQISVFQLNPDIILPSNGEVKITDVENKKNYDVENKKTGLFYCDIPLKHTYILAVSKKGFVTYIDTLHVEGAVFYPQFNVNAILKPKMRNLRVRVTDFSKNNTLNSNITIEGLDNDDKFSFSSMPQKGEIPSIVLRENGKYLIEVLPEAGFSFFSRRLDTRYEKTNLLELRLRSLETGMALPIEGINFRAGTCDLYSKSFEAIDRIAWLLRKNPTMRIELSLLLSQNSTEEFAMNRLLHIKSYIVNKGHEKNRITLSVKKGNSQNPERDNEVELTCIIKALL